MSILAGLGYTIGVAGIVAIAVYYLRRAVLNTIALDQREAALEVEREHLKALEDAAAAARAARAKELDGDIAQVRTADDAARILRVEFERARQTD